MSANGAFAETLPVEEQAELGYQFDFIAPVFHPMLVVGQLMNVVFEDGFAEPEGEPDPEAPLPSYQIDEITEAPKAEPCSESDPVIFAAQEPILSPSVWRNVLVPLSTASSTSS